MTKLLKIGFISLLLLASVTASNTWAQGLADLIGNKTFWTSYEWQEIFEESDFYRLAVWEKSPEKWTRSSTTHSHSALDTYTTRDTIDDLNIEHQISIKVDSEPPRTIFTLEYISSSEINNEHYDKLVRWCNDKFGKAFHSRVDQISFDYTFVKETSVTTWVIGNTIIGVETRPTRKNPNCLETRLSFERLGKTQSGITKPNDLPMPQRERAKSAPAIRVTNKHSLPIQADSNEVKTKSKSKYMQPPYIWENESGVTQVTNDIQEVPENKRAMFEATMQK
jgi:hypothetical protein